MGEAEGVMRRLLGSDFPCFQNHLMLTSNTPPKCFYLLREIIHLTTHMLYNMIITRHPRFINNITITDYRPRLP